MQAQGQQSTGELSLADSGTAESSSIESSSAASSDRHHSITKTNSIDRLISSTDPDPIVHFNANPITDNSGDLSVLQRDLSVLQQVVAAPQDSCCGTAATEIGNSVEQPSSTALSFDHIYSTSSTEPSDADPECLSATTKAFREPVSNEAAELIA